jgi:hypothetical protein
MEKKWRMRKTKATNVSGAEEEIEKKYNSSSLFTK